MEPTIEPIGWYARLLRKPNAALAVAVILLLAGAGVAIVAVVLWSAFGPDGRLAMAAVPVLPAFVAARLARRRQAWTSAVVLDLLSLCLICASCGAVNYLAVRPAVLAGVILLFAVLIAATLKSLLGERWFAPACIVWLLTVAQVTLQHLQPAQLMWLLMPAAALVTLVAWRPWTVMALKQSRQWEIGLSLAAAGAAMDLLILHVLLRCSSEMTALEYGLFGPTLLFLTGACMSLAWCETDTRSSLSFETLRLVCRVVALLLGTAGLLLSMANESALFIAAAMLCVPGPVAWRAGVNRLWPGALSSVGWVVLVSVIWFRVAGGQPGTFADWMENDIAAGILLGLSGFFLLPIAHIARHRNPNLDLLRTPTCVLGLLFVTLAVLRCSSAPDWNHYVVFAFALAVIAVGHVARLAPVVYVGLVLGMVGAWHEGLDVGTPMNIASATSGAVGFAAYAFVLSLVAILSMVQRRQWPGSFYATPAIRIAWVSASAAVLIVAVGGRVDEISAIVGALAAAVLLIVAVWECRPLLAAAGSILFVTIAAINGALVDGHLSPAGSIGFGSAIITLVLGVAGHGAVRIWPDSDRWYSWARALYLGSLSLIVPGIVDAWLAASTAQYQRIALNLALCSGVAILGMAFIPAGLALAMFAALISVSAVVAAHHHSLLSYIGGDPFLHVTAGLALAWMVVSTTLRWFQRRWQKSARTGRAAVAVFDFAIILAALLCGIELLLTVTYQGIGRLINYHVQHFPAEPSGLLDLAALLIVCVVPLLVTRSPVLVTVLYCLLLLVGAWLAMMIPALKPVRDPVTSVTTAVPTAWPLVLMMSLATVTTAFVAAQGIVAHLRRTRAWPSRLHNLAAGHPAWPGFRISVGSTALLIFMVGVWQVYSPWTIVACAATATCLFLLAHRYWNADLAEVAMGHVSLACCSAAMMIVRIFGADSGEFAVRFPVFCNAVLIALTMMIFLWHWLSDVWDQQLDAGQPWTTAGRMIPVAHRFGFLAAALAVLISTSMAFWPLPDNTPAPDNTQARWIFGLIGNALLILVLLRATVQTGREPLAGLVLAAIAVTAVFIGVRLPMNPTKQWLLDHWPVVAAAASAVSVLFALILANTRFSPFVGILTALSVGPLPVVAACGALTYDRTDDVLAVATPALLAFTYMVLAWNIRSSEAALIGAVFLNIAFLVAGRTTGRTFATHYPFYLTLPGATILAIAWLYARYQSQIIFNVIRFAGLLLVFTPQALRLFLNPGTEFIPRSVQLAIFCMAAIALGLLLRAKPLLWMGGTFVLVNVASLAVYSYGSRPFVSVVAAALLAAVIAFAVLLRRRRTDLFSAAWDG
jgi:hypothetical protein